MMNRIYHQKITHLIFGTITITSIISAGWWYQQHYILNFTHLTASVYDTLPNNHLKNLTPEQKIGQLFIMGFDGTDKNSFESFIKKYPLGGVLLLERNIHDASQIKKLTSDVQYVSQKYAGVPLLITVDQEGGLVSRIPFIEDPHTAQPDITSTEQAYTIAYTRGEKLHELGVNLNFSPVLDIAQDSHSFIWSRTFRGTTQKISLLGTAFVQGYADTDIISCPKHFPGHGESITDPHHTISTNSQSTKTIVQQSQPFADAIGSGALCIMVGHAIEKNADQLPASQSPVILQNWLRDGFHFTGTIVTDDMEMEAARATMPHHLNLTNTQSITHASIAALQAGADMILISGHTTSPQEREMIYHEISDAIKNGALTQKQLDEKVSRILALKKVL